MTTPPSANGRRLALIGSPNSGKTTLFNALTGMKQTVANYAGVTVEHVLGQFQVADHTVELIDLPGTYSLEPLSPDEKVTVDVLEGTMEGMPRPDGVVVVADATTLPRSLPLVGEVMTLGIPVVLVLTMIDELKARGGAVKVPVLARALGIRVLGVVGNRGIGIDDVRAVLANPRTWQSPATPPSHDVQDRFAWADEILTESLVTPGQGPVRTDSIDRWVLHPVFGILLFVVVMFLFFQAIFVVAAPIQDLFEGGVLQFGESIRALLPEGLLQSLVVDGIIAGVGGVVVFVPQIALLLLAIALLEGSGYMARAAFLVDRVMGWAGLEGRSFIALLSSYACAIPGVMAARSIPDPKSRLATILVAPLMTCSARIPVYALLIAAFVPEHRVLGFFNLQGIVFFGLYALGTLSAFGAAILMKRGALRGATYPFYMELPPYRIPTANVVFHRVWRGTRAFLAKAGTVILVASIALWTALTFPRVEPPASIAHDAAAATAYQIEHSAAATVGKALEPAIAPLGFDWKIGVGLIASLAAREVIVATLAQIYAFDGDEEDTAGLAQRLQSATRADGSPAYPLPTVLALLVFFVYALQCVSTLAVMRKETGGWTWPAVAFTYMLALAYGAAWVTHEAAQAFLS